MIKKILLGIWVFYLTNLYSSPAGKWITSKNKNDAFEKFSTQDNLHNYIIYLVVIVIITLIVIRILKFFELPKKLKYFRRRAHSNLLDE
ncbi:MAG: hypothetical protein U9N34_02835, partial [Candidatus Cloacimonadota bacterium]|nr:hypothetical protein [Candidatus Cloacimonadota bacterium]